MGRSHATTLCVDAGGFCSTVVRASSRMVQAKANASQRAAKSQQGSSSCPSAMGRPQTQAQHASENLTPRE